MIVIAKAQGLKRGDDKMSQIDSNLIQTFPHLNKNTIKNKCSRYVYLFKNKILLIELSMSIVKLTDKLSLLFCRCSVGLFFKIGNRIINDSIYFLQFRLITNKHTQVFNTLVFSNKNNI